MIKNKVLLLERMVNKYRKVTMSNPDAFPFDTIFSFAYMNQIDVSNELEEALVWFIDSQFNDYNLSDEEEQKHYDLLVAEGFVVVENTEVVEVESDEPNNEDRLKVAAHVIKLESGEFKAFAQTKVDGRWYDMDWWTLPEDVESLEYKQFGRNEYLYHRYPGVDGGSDVDRYILYSE